MSYKLRSIVLNAYRCYPYVGKRRAGLPGDPFPFLRAGLLNSADGDSHYQQRPTAMAFHFLFRVCMASLELPYAF